MPIIIKAIGHDKNSETRDLCDMYLGRCRSAVSLVTHDAKGNQRDENAWLCKSLVDKKGTPFFVIALDSTGKTLTSEKIAHTIQDQQMCGRTVVILIGGAEGLLDSTRQHANLLLSFGSITLPHLLARVVVCEQVYRAECIATGHPYHK